MKIQANAGKELNIWEVDALLAKGGFPRSVVDSVQMSNEDDLLINLKGKKAEAAKRWIEGHNRIN